MTLVEQFLMEKKYNDGISDAIIKKYHYFFSLLPDSDIYPERPETFTSRSLRLHLASQ